jgi:hypothetical protein
MRRKRWPDAAEQVNPHLSRICNESVKSVQPPYGDFRNSLKDNGKYGD